MLWVSRHSCSLLYTGSCPLQQSGPWKVQKDSKDWNLLQDLWGYLAQFKFTLDFHPIIPSSHCLPLTYYALRTESYYSQAQMLAQSVCHDAQGKAN